MYYIKKKSFQTYYSSGTEQRSFFFSITEFIIILFIIAMGHSIIRADEEKVSEDGVINTEEHESTNKTKYSVPVVSEIQSLTEIENKGQIVQKFFKLQTYSPTSMAQIIEPMLSKDGFLSVDEKAREDMINKSDQMGVPVLDINGTIIVGYDQDAIKAALKK